MTETELKQHHAVLDKYFPPAAVDRLLTLAQRHDSLQVIRCNREFTKRETREDSAISQEILEICKNAMAGPVTADLNGDPRGYTVKLSLPGGERNEWGGQYGLG